jgi:hypothetical protein
MILYTLLGQYIQLTDLLPVDIMTYNRLFEIGSYRMVVMMKRDIKVDRLSNNYRELDNDGKETLLRIGEKVFRVKDFVNKEISSLLNENHEIGKLKFENEKP